MAKIIVAVLLVIGVAAWATHAEVPTLPRLDPEEWWGPSELKFSTTVNTTVRPVEIRFSSAMIRDLRSRLKYHFKPNSRTNFAPIEGAAFNYGFSTTQLNPWLGYWLEEYNFKKRERFLNKFPHFMTNIQGLDIHFMHVKPQVTAGVEVIPLLIVHGWPGSVREFYGTIPHLTKQRKGFNFVFEVIIPSLPGFGYSDPPVRPGLDNAHIGVVLKNLMSRLGHEKFVVAGGDWGSLIASTIATMYQDNVLGYITNMMFVLNSCTELNVLAGAAALSQAPPDRLNPLAVIIEENGYTLLQSTKPDTIGIALADSPSGLLCYMLEKFSTWTGLAHRELEDGGLSSIFTKDELLDHIMIYWSSNCITSSMRLDAENFRYGYRALGIDTYPTKVPTYSIQAKNEFFAQPPNYLKFPNLLEHVELSRGGRFLAFECPELYAEQVIRAVQKFLDFHQSKKEL